MSKSRQDVYRAYLENLDRPIRPILTLLNGDASWLMSFPKPQAEKVSSGKAFYHVVFEPWLIGDASILRPWFFNIALSANAAINEVQGINNIIQEIEEAASHHTSAAGIPQKGDSNGGIDAIILRFHYLDHVHEPTLRTFDRHIPVIATPEAAAIVRPWKHFDTVGIIHDLDSSAKSWRSPGLHPQHLLTWLTIIRLPGHATLNFCNAIIWSHLEGASDEIHETILISPHGTRLDQGPLDVFLSAQPKVEMTALLHGLKESHGVAGQTKLGAKGGLALYRKMGGFKSWILSHDNDFQYSGILLWVTRTTDLPRSLEWALEEERRQSDVNVDLKAPNFLQVNNGSAVILT
ncbi:hypothetical protein NW762_009096 [Fusarium torreyae]|uniref:Uncharacterized protein n=1 Tax=Fusarium torreyae TaxID=1237075 RepID=A0A9W8RXH2_9HYPO|nr:hypothetical protein NW762_009096 [Fusarium torreyae]